MYVYHHLYIKFNITFAAPKYARAWVVCRLNMRQIFPELFPPVYSNCE